MYQKQNSIIQTLYAVAIGATLVALALVGINLLPLTVAAQNPATDLATLSPAEKLALFGLTANAFQSAAVVTYDLQTVKQTNVLSVISGSPVTFTISITNLGPNSASYFVFYDNYPAQMKNVAYIFSAPAISGNLFNQQLWLFTNTLPISNKIMITVTGILTSASDVTVKNTATATPLDPTSEIFAANNTSEVSVAITGYMRIKTIYLPVIYKGPPTVTLYLDDFSSTSSGWAHDVSDSACRSYYEGGYYRLAFKATGSDCWRPTPDSAVKNIQPVYAAIQVDAMRRTGSGNVAYGVYMNGHGGSEYYLFKVWPNGTSCSSGKKWELYRKTSRVMNGCSTAIWPDYNVFNHLKIKHTSSGYISVYVNDVLLYTYTDSSQLTGGWGTGIYSYSDDSSSTIVDFDNFTIFDR